MALGKHNTVFQAEIRAFILAVKAIEEVILQHGNPGNVVILSDSQAAIKALDNFYTKSSLVKEAINELNRLSEELSIEIKWIRAHVNFKGNEDADAQAKLGSELEQTSEINIPVNAIKHEIDIYVRDK